MTIGDLDTSSRYLTGEYLADNQGWHEADASWKAAQIRRLAERNRLNITRFCDIGCGTGLCTQLLLDVFPGALGVGYEFSPQAFERARSREAPNLRFHNSSPFDGQDRFDLAIALDVVEHVEDPFAFVRGMAKVSRQVLLHIPLDMNGLSVLREWPIMEARKRLGHLHYFTRNTAIALVRDCGLTVVDELYTPWAIDQSDKSWKKTLAAWPRRVGFALAPHSVVRVFGGWSLLLLAEAARQ